MKAEDVRIGNIVHVPKTNQDIPITAIQKHVGVQVNDNILAILGFDEIESIKLTDEWFNTFGFERAVNGWWDETELFSVYKGKFRIGTNEVADCDYVHELQNLYYIFSRNELTKKQ